MRARVSAKEPEISPKRPRCLLEVRIKITPRCGPGLAAGGLWGRQAGARTWVGTGQEARGDLLSGLGGCRNLWRPGVHFLFPISSFGKPQARVSSPFFPAFSSCLVWTVLLNDFRQETWPTWTFSVGKPDLPASGREGAL